MKILESIQIRVVAWPFIIITPKLCTDFGVRLKVGGEKHLGTLRILV
jgi:hypothetical protein